jgi:hypothetical protein
MLKHVGTGSPERMVRGDAMKRSILLSLVLVVPLLLLAAMPSEAWHGRVFVGVGPWWGPYPYWWYPPPYYYAPPPVIVQEPPVYVQQPTPPPAPAPPAEWYYCASAKGYYPTVPSCPEPWVKVPANP